MIKWFAIILLIITNICYSQNQNYKSLDSSIYRLPIDSNYYIIVEENAIFNHGDFNDFRLYVQKNLKMPEINDTINWTGKTILQFGVDWNGKVGEIEILRSINIPELEDSIIRVIKRCPDWIPAKHKGRRVGQKFVLPIHIENLN